MNNEWEVWTVTGLDVLHEIQNAGFLVALTNLLNYKHKENKTVSQPKGTGKKILQGRKTMSTTSLGGPSWCRTTNVFN